jgi:hypothetical protein
MELLAMLLVLGGFAWLIAGSYAKTTGMNLAGNSNRREAETPRLNPVAKPAGHPGRAGSPVSKLHRNGNAMLSL